MHSFIMLQLYRTTDTSTDTSSRVKVSKIGVNGDKIEDGGLRDYSVL